MLKSLFFLTRLFFFWLLFFFIDRFIFLLLFRSKLSNISFAEVSSTFYHSIRLDMSMAGYLIAIPLLYYIISWFYAKRAIHLNWLKYYHRVLILFFSLVSIVNFNIFREWGSKLSYKAIDVLIKTPNEAMASGASSPLAISLIIYIILVVLGFILEAWLSKREIKLQPVNPLYKAILSFVFLVGTFLFIRGGTQLSPINQSMSYFSSHQVLNMAAVNTEWNLLQSCLDRDHNKGNIYDYMPEATANGLIKQLLTIPRDTTTAILTTQRPNVVLFIMESFTADVVEELGGEKGVSPNFGRMLKDGYFFDNIYSSGDRTDKGFVATLAGFPTQASTSIIKSTDKQQKLPGIPLTLSKNGYGCSFFYGGESEFDNYKAYVLSHGYNKLIDKSSFAAKDMNSKWGAYDEVVFNRQMQEANKVKQPFFSTILTLTNHEPFEVPGTHHFGDNTDINKFKSTSWYTDSCINAYLTNAKKQPWYKNTLFIFVADHGHRLPKNKYEIYDYRRYHVPLLFYGEVIKPEFRGKRDNRLGSQVDIASTLLHQLNLPSADFKWSKNLLNPYTPQYAYSSWDNGFCMQTLQQSISFDNVGKYVLLKKQPAAPKEVNDRVTTIGKAYLQTVYQDMLNY